MKFSLKVFLSTLTVTAVTFALGGSILISSVFHTMLEREVRAALEENQLLRFSFLTASSGVSGDLSDVVVRRIAQTMEQSNGYSQRSLRLSDDAQSPIYASSGVSFGNSLLAETPEGLRTWQLLRTDSGWYIQTACQVRDGGRTLYLESFRDISSIYAQREEHYALYRVLMCTILLAGSAVMYLMARYLTRPIRRLSGVTRRIAQGDYQLRAPVVSQDEVGALTQDFNAMADSLEHKITQLEEAARRQEDFIASFAHELKTPLTAVIGYADMLRSSLLTQEQQFRAASYIFSEGKRLEALSFKLLDLIVLKRQDFPMRPLDAAALLTGLEAALRPAFQQAGVKLTVSARPGAVTGEPDLLKTLLLNLCDNARKASPAGSAVVLSGRPQGEGYLFSVSDRGRGMTSDQLARITEPFYMVDKSRARAQNGAGLGLSLCDAIARLHGGQLRFESAPGEGTTVTLLLGGEHHE